MLSVAKETMSMMVWMTRAKAMMLLIVVVEAESIVD
jgi:hypothetical protein